MNTNQNAAKQIINRFGGQSALAGLLGKRQSTVQHWARTGRIPSQWHEKLLELARQQGIALEPRDFVSADTPRLERHRAAGLASCSWGLGLCRRRSSPASSTYGGAPVSP